MTATKFRIKFKFCKGLRLFASKPYLSNTNISKANRRIYPL